jgi:5-oxoprolinase (ATP-hydrolysing)
VFVANYRREYGFELTNRSILIDDIRIRAIGKVDTDLFSSDVVRAEAVLTPPPPEPSERVLVYFNTQRILTPVYYLHHLLPHQLITGPAMIIQDVATVVIEPNCTAVITALGDIEITIDCNVNHQVNALEVDPIYLSIFSHRFMGIAEQMGRTLQRTSISVNIKERLDFSCALFDSHGNLVANAPHLPVHLGAMSEAVKYQIAYWGDAMQEGDVLVSNHPQLAGGSHLPDITVITPIYWMNQIVFYVASRGHHADVGGIAPGSMPPLSKTLEEEGAAIIAFKLVKDGVFQEAGIIELLSKPGQLPNNCGARNISDNISDLKAQVAANRRGAMLMNELVQEYGLPVVQAYMEHIQDCAELAVRAMLKEFSLSLGLQEVDSVSAVDFLDDGSMIKLRIEIDRRKGSAVFDFAGSGYEIAGNLNAPPAVTASAVIYCLRCLLPETDIPLNQGCLAPIEIRIPANSLLKPSPHAAVVGGNVLTSQRVTDVILRAFNACAASQGCMNNLTFGDARMGYYETIAGGAGAGPTWHGCSAVHTHMTNTRITDVEILERRYPVIVRQFSVRKGSGGAGRHHGGDGVIRELEFTKVQQYNTQFYVIMIFILCLDSFMLCRN